MTFAALPLLVVLGAMAAAAIATVMLYLLRRTPRPRVVSNVKFWLKAAQSARPKWLFSVRIPLFALLLSLLAVLAIVALVGDPRFGSGVRGTTVIVISTGRTMGAEGDDGRRLDRALLEVSRWVERSTITGEVAIVRAGMRPSVLMPVTDDAAGLMPALEGLEVDDGPADLAAALDLADAILREHAAAEGSQILLVSDIAVEHPTRAPLVVLPVGTAADTVAISAFAARRTPGAVGEYTARIELTSHTSRVARARLVVRDGDVEILEERVELAPHERRILDAGGFSSARAELRAELTSISIEGSHDALAADDRAYAVIEPLAATRVLLVTDGNRFLEAALQAHPGIDAEVVDAAGLATLTASTLASYHALVLDGIALPAGTEHAAQLLFAPPQRGPVIVGRALTNAHPTASLSSHPALDGVRFDGVHVSRATPLSEAHGDQVILRSGRHTLALARQNTRARLVAFGFSPADTDMVRREAFPLLVHNVLRWITDRAEPTPLARRLGGALVADAGHTLADPDGNLLERPAGVIPAVSRAGIWHIGDRAIAYGATEHAEALSAGAVGGTFASRSSLPPLAVLIASVLGLLLIVEWALLHRGKLE